MGKNNKKKNKKSSVTPTHSSSGKDSVPSTQDLKKASQTENSKTDQIPNESSTNEKESKTNAPVPIDTNTKMADNVTTTDTLDSRGRDQKKEIVGELDSGQKQQCEKHSKEIKDLQMKLQNQKAEIKILNTKIDDLKKSPENHDQMTKRLEQEANEFKKVKKELEELKHLVADKDGIIQSKELMEKQLNKRITDCDAEKAELEQAYRQEREMLTVKLDKSMSERDSYKTRFSQLAGSRLMYRNEGITDLSDSNRPDKLAERYNELYDNQWTDAYEEIDENSNDEKETIDKLLAMFKDCVQFCAETADRQKVRIQEFFMQEFILLNRTQDEDSTCNGNPDCDANEISENDMKNLTDIRKSCGNACLPALQKIFYAKYPNHMTESHIISCYIEKSLDICWFSAIQEPPLSFDWSFDHGCDIQSGLVKNYTVNGNKVDFVVWPTLRLKENGSILVKGVVQAINEKKARQK